MTKIVVLMIIGFMIPFAFAQDEEIDYSELAWQQFTAGRKCFEQHDGTGGMYVGFEECMKIQLTCKLIYDGIANDEKRKWLTQTPSVKKYVTTIGLKPLDYLHILNLISKEQSTIKK